jgi:uncharacterized membrane protein YgdD (TMEM256/DUF423 family)
MRARERELRLFPEINVRASHLMTTPARRFCFPLFTAGVLGLTGVALGAMGAHALKATLLERGMMNAWETSARYHLFHAVAALGVAAWVRTRPSDPAARGMFWAVRLWLLGTVLFSGSLYWLAVGGPRWLGPVTPFGGVALMIGWLLVALAAFRNHSRPGDSQGGAQT